MSSFLIVLWYFLWVKVFFVAKPDQNLQQTGEGSLSEVPTVRCRSVGFVKLQYLVTKTVNQPVFTNSNDQIQLLIPRSRSYFEDPRQRWYDHICHDNVINRITRCCTTRPIQGSSRSQTRIYISDYYQALTLPTLRSVNHTEIVCLPPLQYQFLDVLVRRVGKC